MADDGHNRTAGSEPKSARDWHVQHVYNDPDFIQATRRLRVLERRAGISAQEVEQHRQGLAASYAISVSDLNLFMLPLYLQNRTSTTKLGFDMDNRQFSITFEPTTTRAEILEEWERFENLRTKLFPNAKSTAKRKPPEQPSLLYAIFKARQRRETFRQIFEQYSSGTLPGYTGSTTQFTDEERLERHYNRYKP